MTLAAHAGAALRDETPLRLPAHPAFIAVRRATMRDGDTTAGVAAWFARVQSDGGPVLLAGAGMGSDAALASGPAGWRVHGADAGVVLLPAERPEVMPLPVDAAAERLRSAAQAASTTAGDAAPPLWSSALERAAAILESDGTGEELSDVAWPHFLLPPSDPLPARRLAAAAATLWLWDGPGSWAGDVAERAHGQLRDAVAIALIAAVASAQSPGAR